MDKDQHWFHRYRVTDGYSTYGDRAFLTFVRGTPRNVNAEQKAKAAPEDVLPTNYDVLQRELPILDAMTRNRDRRIWALAARRLRRANRSEGRRLRHAAVRRREDRTSRRTPVFMSGAGVGHRDDGRARGSRSSSSRRKRRSPSW